MLKPTKFLFTMPILLLLVILFACKKTPQPAPPVTPPVVVPPANTDTTIKPGIDPATANTIGFFLDGWQPKTYSAPAYTEAAIPALATNTVTVDATSIITKIPVAIFGHNAVMWMGPVANETKFLEPVTNLNPHILRFPGGSASDAYFWNAAQGALPADAPTILMDASGTKKEPGYNFGKTGVNWQSNLDDYYAMRVKTNTKGIITVNYGYARYGTSANPVATAAHLAADWVRYDNNRTQLWEIGNENFGNWEAGHRINVADNKDGQTQLLSGTLYGTHFKVYADSMRKAAAEVGNTGIKIGVVLTDADERSNTSTITPNWNAGVLSPLVSASHLTEQNGNRNDNTVIEMKNHLLKR